MATLPKHLQILVDELTFVSLTQSNEKINFSSKTTVDGSSIYGWIYRRVYFEGVDNLILNLRNLVEMVEESLQLSIVKEHRVQILTKVIDFHKVLIDQISLYDKYHHTKANLIGLRDRISSILLTISAEDKVLIGQRQQLNDAKFTINIIGSGTPPSQSPLANKLSNER